MWDRNADDCILSLGIANDSASRRVAMRIYESDPEVRMLTRQSAAAVAVKEDMQSRFA